MPFSDHYLFVMWDGGGAVPPILEIAAKIKAAGKQVSILGENSMQPEVEAIACHFIPYQYAPNRPDRAAQSDPYPDWDGRSPFQVLRKLLFEHAEVYAKDVLACCREQTFDIVVVDGFLLGAMVGAEAAEKPFVVLWPAIDPIPHPGRPPDGLGLFPGKTVWGKTRNRALNWLFKKILQSGRNTLNPLREKLGLAPLKHPFEMYRKAKNVILLSSSFFDYPVKLPLNTHFFAPQLQDPSWAPATTIDIQEPYILVSLGSTFQDQQALYQKLMDTLSQLSIPVIITLGNVFSPEAFRSYANIQVFQAASHSQLIPACGLVIHHGGHGITMKSILAGLPQLVIPLGRDQFGNAARIVYHGIGLRATPKTPADRLLKMIRTLLSQEKFGQSAHLMSQKIKQEIRQQSPLAELL